MEMTWKKYSFFPEAYELWQEGMFLIFRKSQAVIEEISFIKKDIIYVMEEVPLTRGR